MPGLGGRAGTGILSLFAASAGAKKVYSVEMDRLLVKTLESTANANNLGKIIHVIEGDALQIKLPRKVDVVIAELIDTALIDELQVAVMNRLHRAGVIGSRTRVIPCGYETSVQLVEVGNTYYGYKINAPIHQWPYYSKMQEEWAQIKIEPASEVQQIGMFDFQYGVIDPEVDKVVEFHLANETKFNAVRLSGILRLTANQLFGAGNMINGDKILFVGEHIKSGKVCLKIRYTMSGGFPNLSCKIL